MVTASGILPGKVVKVDTARSRLTKDGREGRHIAGDCQSRDEVGRTVVTVGFPTSVYKASRRSCHAEKSVPWRRLDRRTANLNVAQHFICARNETACRLFVVLYEFPVRINLESRLFAVRCDEDLVVPGIAETQPQLQPVLLRLSISQYCTHALCLGHSKCYQGWLCWRRIYSPNHDAQAGWLLYAVDRFSVERSQS